MKPPNEDDIRKALLTSGLPEGYEQTLILVKPDGVTLGIHHAIVALYQARELPEVASKRILFDAHLACAFYAANEGKPYFQELIQFMASGPSKAYVLEGHSAVARAHELAGATNPRMAQPTSMRGLFRGHFDDTHPAANFVHASRDLLTAAMQITLLFRKYPV